MKLEFLEFRGQTFRQKVSKIAVLKGKSRVVCKIRKSIMIVARTITTGRNSELFLWVRNPSNLSHFEADVFPEIEGDFLNVNGIGKPYAVQCGFSYENILPR